MVGADDDSALWLQELLDYNRQAIVDIEFYGCLKSEVDFYMCIQLFRLMVFLVTGQACAPTSPKVISVAQGGGMNEKIYIYYIKIDHRSRFMNCTILHPQPFSMTQYSFDRCPCTADVTCSGPSRNSTWQNSLDAATLALHRTKFCFDQIESDSRLDYQLPKNATGKAGYIIKNVYASVDRILERWKPCIYKFGYTHCAYFRFYNDMYGYCREADGWEKMVVLYAASETISPSFIEGALIQRHKGILAKQDIRSELAKLFQQNTWWWF